MKSFLSILFISLNFLLLLLLSVLLTSSPSIFDPGDRWEACQRRDALVPPLFFVWLACALLSVSFSAGGRRIGVALVSAGGVVVLMIIVPATRRSGECGVPHEASALSRLRTINTAEVTYFSSNKKYGTVPELVTQGLLDDRFLSPSVDGYRFAVIASERDYTASATPASKNAGRFGYYSTPDAVVRYATTATVTCAPCFPAGLSGSPVQ